MGKKPIKSVAGLQRAWNAENKKAARLYKRPYILLPALARHLDQFKELEQLEDVAARYQAFRRLPALESVLAAVNGSLTPKQRESLAQQDRARRPRVRLTDDGRTLETIVFALLSGTDDPWRHKAKQYWSLMIDRLHQLGLNPTSITDPDDPSVEKLQYGFGDKRRSLTLGQFENIVSKVRGRLSGGLN
jgi:hypothetical protein